MHLIQHLQILRDPTFQTTMTLLKYSALKLCFIKNSCRKQKLVQKIKQSAFHKNNVLQQYTCKEFASKLIIKNLITSFHLLFPVKHS